MLERAKDLRKPDEKRELMLARMYDREAAKLASQRTPKTFERLSEQDEGVNRDILHSRVSVSFGEQAHSIC